MAQHDYVIANANGAAVRADINNALLAISSTNSGSSERSTTYAYELWLDTTNNLLKLRNAANDAWITLGLSVTASNTVDIDGGAIDGTAIGANSATTGAFTTVTASSTISGTSITASTSLLTPLIEYTDGDDAITIADGGGVTIADLTATTADINAGSVDNATIGAATANTGAFTTLAASGATDLNSTVAISGHVSLDGSANELRFYEGANYVGFEAPSLSADQIWILPIADGSADQVLSTNGSGTLSWATAGGGGASDINGLSDCLVENNSIWIGNDPSGTTSTATGNIALGTTALDSITTGDNNVALGYDALAALDTESGNTAVGYQALTTSHTNGTNTAVGYQAGSAVTDGAGNNLFGYQCGDAITTGYGNDCFGSHSMDTSAAITGYTNVCFGQSSFRDLTSGIQNSGVGNANLANVTTGSTNTAIGYNTLKVISAANANTALGASAGLNVTDGENNLLLGYTAGITGSPGGNITTGDNQVCLGDENITNAHIQVDWTIASDKRDKTDVEPMDLGLEFINQLEPVTYRWDKRSKYSGDQSVSPDGTHKEEQLEGGFLAQDVEAIEEQYGHKLSDNTNLTFNLSEDEQMYGIRYSKFVPMLVKAVQELSAEVEALKKGKNNGSN